jgi:hypothetical protein
MEATVHRLVWGAQNETAVSFARGLGFHQIPTRLLPTSAMSTASVNELTSRLQLAQMQEQQEEMQAQAEAARAKRLLANEQWEAAQKKIPATNFAVAEAEESGYG